MITFFFSTIGLENATREDLEGLLVLENLVTFKPGRRHVEVMKFVDPSANEMWSVNVVVGDEDGTFVEGGCSFAAYPRP